jgi:hypothetical protein
MAMAVSRPGVGLAEDEDALSGADVGRSHLRHERRDFPHIVELPLPSGVFRSSQTTCSPSIVSGGSGLLVAADGNDEQCYVHYCFDDPAHADAFRHQFGGERITSPPRRGEARG